MPEGKGYRFIRALFKVFILLPGRREGGKYSSLPVFLIALLVICNF
jgi:hypothetical protein